MKMAGKYVFLSTSLILVALHLSVWIQDNHAFAVKKIVIRGAKLIEPVELLNAAKIDDQENLMDANVKLIQQRLRKLPEIADVRVSRIFPSSLRIEIRERRPVAVIVDNGIWGIDASGTVLPRLPARHGLDYPVITGFKLAKHIPGEKVENIKLLALATFLGELQDALPSVYHLISEISLHDLLGVRFLTVEHNFPVILGSADLIKKCRQFEASYQYLLAENRLENMRYLDLRFHDQVIARHKA